MFRNVLKSASVIVTAIILLTAVSCDPAKKYEKQEKDDIASYLSTHDGFDHKESGLYYLDVTVGTGLQPSTHDTAYVYYTGKFLNGNTFDTNVGGTKLVFPVNEGLMITGFDEGITYMKEGGKATLLLPSNLAYGTQGYYTIPGYTPLLYDVELVKVVPSSKK
jgi:FKBP-type peptidyl-prolyl cis-trans isomerase FkpA